MNLTKHFTLEELTKSATAVRLGIENRPTSIHTGNLLDLCQKILEPIRLMYGKPIIVSSGYRCIELNKIVGGSATSQHCLGEAADIHSLSDTKADNEELWNLIVAMIQNKNIEVGQLINEYEYDWIHISLPTPIHNNEVKDIN